MQKSVFKGSFTQQEPLPEDAIEAAVEVMRSGRLHRYNLLPGEEGHVSALEREFAALTGAKYALAVASGGYAMGCVLRALDIGHGDLVLSNGFTLAPVPGAIASVGAEPVFVETAPDLTIDLDDLELKAAQTGARVVLLSHMRGHLCDMDKLMGVAERCGLTVIEDCAHTMGAAWNGVPSGRHGHAACYSTQTYKHINSGEGGIITTDDSELVSKAVILSGSYMLYGKHTAAPAPEMFEKAKYMMPNVSGRMDHLRAAILRPQLRDLPRQVARWNSLYRVVEAGLRNVPGVDIIERPAAESIVGSSIQWRLPDLEPGRIQGFVAACAARGVELKWFGAREPIAFTSRYDSWKFAKPQSLPKTDHILAGLIDMRLPLTFDEDDARLIAEIVRDEALSLNAETTPH